jgi:hypothetical protein
LTSYVQLLAAILARQHSFCNGADPDAYTSDATLLAEQPDFYLSEQGLRTKVRDIQSRMHRITAERAR